MTDTNLVTKEQLIEAINIIERYKQEMIVSINNIEVLECDNAKNNDKEKYLDVPIIDLPFTARANNTLRNAGIETVRDLIKVRNNDYIVKSSGTNRFRKQTNSEYTHISNCWFTGVKTMQNIELELQEYLRKYNLEYLLEDKND